MVWADGTLEGALKRKVKIPKKLMGGYDIYPNTYIILRRSPWGRS